MRTRVFFSYSSLSSFLACFRANNAVVFLLNSSYFVLPIGACPYLTGSSAVQHVSVLRNDFSHTFPYVVSLNLPLFYIPLIPSLFLLYLCFSCFYVSFPVSRSLSCTPHPPFLLLLLLVASPLLLLATLSCWWRMFGTGYRNSFPQMVPLFSRRSTTEIAHSNDLLATFWFLLPQWLMPLLILHSLLFVIALTLNPEPPRLLPYMSDFAIQVEIETSTAHDTWCSLMTDYSSVDLLQRAFDEAKIEPQTYFDLNSQLLEDMAEAQRQASAELTQLRSEHEALLRDKGQLKASLADLNATHNELMAHSLNQTEQIGELRSTLPERILCLRRQILSNLPTDFDEEMTPDDTLYQFLCSSPDADAATLSSNSNLLLQSLHPDKSSTPEDPLVQAAGRLVPLITIIKRNLTSPPSVKFMTIVVCLGYAVYYSAFSAAIGVFLAPLTVYLRGKVA